MASIIKVLCKGYMSVKESFLALDRDTIAGLCISGGLFAYSTRDDSVLFQKSITGQILVTAGSISIGALTGWIIHVYRPISYCFLTLPVASILIHEILD